MQLNQQHNNLYILSAMNSNRTIVDNETRHETLKSQLKMQNVSFTECEGRYDGIKEKSLILIGTHKLVAHHYASIYGQSAFLKLEPHKDNMYKAYFVEVETGDEIPAGYFRSFSEEVILSLGLDYTKDSEGTYFSIWHSDISDMAEFMHEISSELLQRMESGGRQ